MIKGLVLLAAIGLQAQEGAKLPSVEVKSGAAVFEPKLAPPLPAPKNYVPMRGVHLTSWVAGSSVLRRKFLEKSEGSVINAVVVPLKETDGLVYIPGVASAVRHGTQRTAIPKPAELVADLHARKLKAVARIVVFADNTLARKVPRWAIQNEKSLPWEDDRRLTWIDPYKREAWEHVFEIADKAVDYGFDEIQFDYIRFPADGETSRCRFSAPHSSSSAVALLGEFLAEGRRRMALRGVPVSVAVFGLVTSAEDDLGIGQVLEPMTRGADAVSPMMYPSHYAKGAYGLAHPNASPYEVIDRGLRHAVRRMGGEAYKLRPYLQDFSLGVRYREKEVRAQFKAARERGVVSWILWNPQNRYTWEALRD